MRSPCNATLLLAVIALPIPTSAQNGPLALDDSTVALYHLDGNGHPVGPGQPRLAKRGDVSYGAGKFGKALCLSGQSALSAYRAAGLIPGDGSWLVECWIKPDGKQTNRACVWGAFGGHGREYSLRIVNNKSLVGVFAASSRHRAQVSSHDVSATLFDGQWHHVALALDRERSGELRLYLDGKQVSGKPKYLLRPILVKTAFTLTLGAWAPWTAKKDGFNGAIDEFRVSSIIRPECAASPDAPEPLPVPERKIHTSAAVSPDASESKTAVTLNPETTTIAVSSYLALPADNDAARLLSEWLRKAYGVEAGFSVVHGDEALKQSAELILAVGRTQWVTDEEVDGLDLHGILIRRKRNVVAIAGGSADATLWASVSFLDRYCGVRFYMPGDLFTSLPAERKVSLGTIDVEEAPYVRSCSLSGLGHNNYRVETPWSDRNAVNRRRGGTHQHSMFKYFPPERYAKKCPEIYPTIKGERYIPKRGDRFWQPCFSEPKLVDAAVESALRYFKANPDHEYIAFSVEDGHQFCECERCRAEWAKNVERTKARETQPRRIKMIANALTHSPLYWRFMNRAAERLERELPAVGITAQKLVVGIVYSGVRENPGFGLHPMVLTWFVFKWSDGLIDRRLLPQPDGRYQLGRMQEWLDISSHIGHHDWAHGKGFLIPRLYTELTSESFKLFKPHDLVYTHTEGYPNWGLDGPKLYVHSKIWWNPDVDLARIWRQFCDDMFGPAADPMRDYFDTLHDLWIVLNSDQERKLNRWHNQFDTTPKQREQIAHCRSLLERASQFAETDEQRQRIELFSKTFGLSERFFAMAAKRKATPVEVNQLLDYARKHITPDPMTVYRMRTPEDAMDRISTAVWRLAGSRGLRKPE